ncbi:MAG: histidinol dehydrogenase [Phycisphaerae bacterium]|nr:histidinol dehydrogenase [Phycisphaerae bacterium]
MIPIPILYANRPADQLRLAEIKQRLSLRPMLLEDAQAEGGESRASQVRQIIRQVQREGDAGLVACIWRFEKAQVRVEQLRVPPAEIAAARAKADPAFIAAMGVAITNVRRYQQAMLPAAPASLTPPTSKAGQARLAVRYVPLDRVGLYIPGGAAAYPSSVIMTAVPAQVAGVKSICMATPLREGKVSPAVLAAAALVGIEEVYTMGGAQAIAALALGTPTIPAVDKIVGPGNTWVQLAKKELFGIVDIDSFAGPSEVVVLADETADPEIAAAELLAQAEHAPGSCLLITCSEALASAVQTQMARQLDLLSRRNITIKALEFASAVIVEENPATAIALVNALAPEHLQIMTRDGRSDAAKIRHAGAIFIGAATPVAAGDYLAGPSHVLPTSGTARFFRGLSAESFRKRISVVELDAAALAECAQAIETLAMAEGFDGHARSVAVRNRG